MDTIFLRNLLTLSVIANPRDCGEKNPILSVHKETRQTDWRNPAGRNKGRHLVRGEAFQQTQSSPCRRTRRTLLACAPIRKNSDNLCPCSSDKEFA